LPVDGVVLAVGDRPTLLVLRALGLGDLLTAVPALRALADGFPAHRKLLAAPAQLRPVLDLAFPDSDGYEILEATGLAPLPRSLRASVAVNLHGRGPESHRVLLALEPGRLIAFANRLAGVAAGPIWKPGEHEVARWCRMLAESGVEADPRRLRIDRPPPTELASSGASVIHPGAADAARRWPWRRWGEVARRELAAGREVLITGTPAERPLALAIAREAGLPAEAVIAGRTGLMSLAAVIAEAGRVASGDTGVAHLATALGRPSVVLFGPVSPAEWGPPARGRRIHRTLWAGRRGDPHGATIDPGLLRISVDEVADALAEVSE
jgi:ADP-heptose:LPS heptosyltransferase